MAEARGELVRILQGSLLTSMKNYKKFHRSAAASLIPDGQVGPFVVLMALSSNPGMNGQGLAEHLGLDKGAVSRHLQLLEAEGLALRSPAPEDGRSSLWRLSEKAEERLKALRADHAESWTAKLSAWDEDKLESLIELLGELNRDLA